MSREDDQSVNYCCAAQENILAHDPTNFGITCRS